MKNTKDKVAGKAKETEGKITGDKAREAQGKGQNLFGKAKEKLDEAADTIKEKIDQHKD
jgi:uncharacterized protein YjbJ (UPF0337 family)